MVHQVWRDREGAKLKSFTVFEMGYILKRPPGWREYRGRLQNLFSRRTHEEVVWKAEAGTPVHSGQYAGVTTPRPRVSHAEVFSPFTRGISTDSASELSSG